MRLNNFMSDLTKIAVVNITYNLHASDSGASFQSLSMKPQTNIWTVYTCMFRLLCVGLRMFSLWMV